MDRQQLTTRAGLNRLRDRVRSTLHPTWSEETRESDEDDLASTEADTESDGTGNLFHCHQCGVVFIATEKETCSQCDVEVEQVRSTLSCR